MGDKDPQKQGDVPVHPKENRGLAAKLRAMLRNPDDTAENRAITEEHQALERQKIVDRSNLRRQALNELTDPEGSGLVTASPEEINAKMAEIEARNSSDQDGGDTPPTSSENQAA